MTSGAVQPPGSHGTEIIHAQSHDSEDPDHSNFTDDENDHQKREDDEEEQLMKSGGSGIPIGPVCCLFN